MALGGGTFTTQNKILPGSYINFISLAAASATLSDRGVATMGLELDWGPAGKVFEVTNGDFQKNSVRIFGYDFGHDKMKGLRDLFLNTKTLYAYRLNSGGKKASNTYATAKYDGTRGNDLKTSIQKNVDDSSAYDVTTFLDNVPVDVQTVKAVSELKENDFVTFKSFELSANAGTPLSGGTNGTVNGSSHQAYLDKIESYSFNTIGVVTTPEEIKGLYINFTRRLRDEIGAKFQCVVYDKAADYEGVINVKNQAEDDEAALVYWVTGATAGCPVNRSLLNRKYDGEFIVNVDYTQNELITAIQQGEFVFHAVGSDIRVLEDVNSLVTTTDTKGDIFKDNQTIRCCDQIANDIAVIFNTKYLGVVPNDAAGRISLWADIVKHHEQLQYIRAIENFKDEDVTVTMGDTKKAVVVHDAITVVNAMAKLYMTVTIA